MNSLLSFEIQSLESYRARLTIDIEQRRGPALAIVQTTVRFPDVYVASACLQKALRRGQLEHAIAAGRYLLGRDPERLWRRLCVCAFEDFGLVDLNLTAVVTVAAASKSLRLVLGEADVFTYLVERLCQVPKDRRLDDLYALGAASFGGQALELPQSSCGPLVHQASRLIARCERKVPQRSFRVVVTEAAERALDKLQSELGFSPHLKALCALGVRVSRCLLPVLLPLAFEATARHGGLGASGIVALPPAPLIAGIPAYAMDGFTRIGRQVLSDIGRSDSALRSFTAGLTQADRLDVLHHLLFYAEAAMSTPLVEDELSRALLYPAMGVGARAPIGATQDAIAAMARLLPLSEPRLRALTAAYPQFVLEGEQP